MKLSGNRSWWRSALLTRLDRGDRSRRMAWAIAVLLALAGFWLILPLMDRYHLYVFEPDSPTAVLHTVGFMHLFRTGSVRLVPPIGVYPPFFDGPFILYGLVALAIRVIRATGLAGAGLLTDDSLAIAAIRYTNMLALAMAVAPLFAAVRLLSRRNSVALLLAVIFLLSPPILRMDLLRIDHVIVLALASVIFLSLYVAGRQRGLWVYMWLGIISAFLANTKITAPVFAIIPVLALGLASCRRVCRWRSWAGFAGAGLVAGSLLGIRFVLLGTALPTVIREKLADHRLWQLYFPIKPYHYYNWDYFLPYGRGFVLSVGLALLLTLWRLRKRRCGAVVVPTACLLLLSLLLVPMIKYPRGGYLLIPLYLLVLAAGFSHLSAWLSVRLRSRRQGGMVAVLLALVLLVPACPGVASHYRQLRRQAIGRADSVRVTRVLPREWFQRHVPPGARVAIFRWSEFCNPPIWDLGYQTVGYLLQPPIMEPERMANYSPPSYGELDTQCDILLLDSFKRWQLQDALGRFAPAALRRQWQSFWDGLDDRYPLMSYQGRWGNYSVSGIQVYIINPGILVEAPDAFRDAPLRGIKFSPPRGGRDDTTPVMFPWLGNYDERAFPWIEHAEFGRVRIGKNPSDEGLWLYVESLESWFWSRKAVFPRLLRQRDNAWLRYHRGTRDPLVFFNLARRREETY